jgi:hypothetical protein
MGGFCQLCRGKGELTRKIDSGSTQQAAGSRQQDNWTTGQRILNAGKRDEQAKEMGQQERRAKKSEQARSERAREASEQEKRAGKQSEHGREASKRASKQESEQARERASKRGG